ncbi:MAG: hypothetical protein K6C94_05240 [Candidatus Gastranaerophilales bacterium]|nr:hypothetical protein [Candidatus Gastranaerophilales bacterium]
MNDDKNKNKKVEIKGDDPRMRFRNSQDPLYVAYDFLERQSIGTLFQAFLKDIKFNITEFFKKHKKKK